MPGTPHPSAFANTSRSTSTSTRTPTAAIGVSSSPTAAYTPSTTTTGPSSPPLSPQSTFAASAALPSSSSPKQSPHPPRRTSPTPTSPPPALSSTSGASSSSAIATSSTATTTAFSTLGNPTPPHSQPTTISSSSSGTGMGPTVGQQAAAGLKGMAAAAKKNALGVEDVPGEMNGDDLLLEPAATVASALVASNTPATAADDEQRDSHPLSGPSLEARGYHSFMCLGRPFHVEKRWKLVRELGQGAYGLVVSAQDDISGETIAIKMITRVFDKVILARRALREITLLRHFAAHENITGLIDLDVVHPDYNEIYMFMEPMEADLHQIIRSGQQLSNSHVQYFMYQLLRGMKYIHSANVLHRDIKPGNVLVNADCELKICDFGLARGFDPDGGSDAAGGPKGAPLTEYVATRWYRAPEIMLSFRRYTTGIDIWSIGCILAELLGGKPIFKGKDYVDQLNLILAVLGSPDDGTLSRVGSDKACKYIRSLPQTEPVPFRKLYPHADHEALDLLSKLLTFDPADRIPVAEALAHPYLAAYHDEADEPVCPAVFDKWEEVESLDDIAGFRASIEREVTEFRAEVRAVDELEPPACWGEESYEGEYSSSGGGLVEGSVSDWTLSSESGGPAEQQQGGGELADPTAIVRQGEDEAASTTTTEESLQYEGLGHHYQQPSDASTASNDAVATSSPALPPAAATPRPISRGPPSAGPSSAIPFNDGPRSASSIRNRPGAWGSLPRRPSSGFFDPYGRRPNSLIFTSSAAVPGSPTGHSPSSTNHPPAAAGYPHHHPPHGPGHAHSQSQSHTATFAGSGNTSAASSAEAIRPPRSRQHSASGDGFRPLLRSLSTVSLSNGGAAILGFSKVSPAPPHSDRRVADDADPGEGRSGCPEGDKGKDQHPGHRYHDEQPHHLDISSSPNAMDFKPLPAAVTALASPNAVPPMPVSASDAPASELPLEFSARKADGNDVHVESL